MNPALLLLALTFQAAPVLPSGPQVLLEGLAGAEPRRLPLAQLRTSDPRLEGAHLLRFEGLGAPAAGAGEALLELRGGERLLGRLLDGAGESLTVELGVLVRLSVTLDDLIELRWPARVPAGWSAAFERAVEGDRLYRRKGDTLERIDGSVERFGRDELHFHGQLVGPLRIPWSEVVALLIHDLGEERALPADDRVPVVLDLVDRSRLRGRLIELDGERCRIAALRGQELLLPVATLALLTVDDGRVRFLANLPPTEAPPSAPFGDELGMVWPPQIDRSVALTPLSVGGRVFARGIGVHAPSRLVWQLDGSWSALRGLAGIDDSTLRLEQRGSALFRVLVDGQERWRSPLLLGGAPAQPFQVDLTGAGSLELLVEPSEDGFAGDRADWLLPLLVRAQAGEAR